MLFNERLGKFRHSKGLTKREIAELLDVSESYYNIIENNKRKPSNAFVNKLVTYSELPEEYWLDGVKTDEYIDIRNDFKSLSKATEQLLELNLINDVDELFKDNFEKGTLEELLIAALKADIHHLLIKKNNKAD